MHSAIIVVEIPEQHFNAMANQAWLNFIGQIDRLRATKTDPVSQQRGVEQLAENVWLVNFRMNPAALARIVEAAEGMGFVYKILPLVDEPRWLPVELSPKPSEGRNVP
jgi:hypothetical protein